MLAVSEAPKTAVVCDSTSYLPPELLADRGVEQISLYVTLAGRQQPETEIDDYAGFFRKLQRSDEGATTSQPSVGDFVSVYRPLLDAGLEIVSIHLSAGISGTFESARQARQQLVDDRLGGDRIRIYDSRSACGGLGMTVLAAAKAATAGAGGEEVLAAAEAARGDLRMWFAVDTLEYLRRGGRIGAARAWLGSALQIKPILTLEEEVTPVERVRTRRRAFERLVQFAREMEESGRDGWVVQHVQDPENAQRLAAEAREVFGSDPVFVSEIGPVIGAHTGPGLLGIGGLPRRHID
jgi:DegV family protein with EDD domain